MLARPAKLLMIQAWCDYNAGRRQRAAKPRARHDYGDNEGLEDDAGASKKQKLA